MVVKSLSLNGKMLSAYQEIGGMAERLKAHVLKTSVSFTCFSRLFVVILTIFFD